MEHQPTASMFTSLILTALLMADGQDTTTTLPLTMLYSPDVPMNCNPLQNCQLQGDFPNRGFCVSNQKTNPDVTGAGQVCWDVCNPLHNTTDYTVNGNGLGDVVNIVAEGMVAQVRAGLNNNVSCPERLGLSNSLVECPPGDDCPKALRHQFKVPYGRGLCVVKGDETRGYACFDMCDKNIPAARFSEGAHQGIALKVMNFRSSGQCNDKPWLPWVICLGLVLLIGACCGLLYFQRRKSSRRADMSTKEDEDSTNEQEESHEAEEMPPFEDRPGYAQEMYRGQPGYGQDDAEYGMRASASSEVPPMSGQFQGYMPDQLGVTSGSMKIPGLDEPHLPMPSVGFQIPSNTAMSTASASGQQYAMGMPLLTPSSPQAAYTTQLPSYPANSPGSRVYATTLPATYAPASGGSVRLSSPAPVRTVAPSPPYTTTYVHRASAGGVGNS